MTEKFLKWSGPGYYATDSYGINIRKIGGKNLSEAQGLARLVGLKEKQVAWISEVPEDTEFITVINRPEESKKKDQKP